MAFLSSNSISLIPGTTFLLKHNQRVTASNFSKKVPKNTFLSQRFVLPLPTCSRRDCTLLYKHARHIASATESEVTVEETNLPLLDNSNGGKSKSEADAVESTVKSSFGSGDASGSAQPRNTRPGRKSEMPPVKNEELVAGAMFTGKVRAIQQFGAFVDFGAFSDGLVHVSRLSDSFVKDVGSVVSVGQEVKVRLIEANLQAGRISLSMREDDEDAGKSQQLKDTPAAAAKDNRLKSVRKGQLQKSKYVVGQQVEGVVKERAPTGNFISFPDGEEGFLPIAEEPGSLLRPESEKSSLNVGDILTARVLRFSKGQAILTLKEEDNDGEGDAGIFQGEVPASANPFLTAFRLNKEISSVMKENAVASASPATDE